MNPRINVYYTYDDEKENIGHIKTITFPDRDAVHFDEEKGTIDIDPLNDYKGYPISIHFDDVTKRGVINKIDVTSATQEDGSVKDVKAIFIEWEDEIDEEG